MRQMMDGRWDGYFSQIDVLNFSSHNLPSLSSFLDIIDQLPYYVPISGERRWDMIWWNNLSHNLPSHVIICLTIYHVILIICLTIYHVMSYLSHNLPSHSDYLSHNLPCHICLIIYHVMSQSVSQSTMSFIWYSFSWMEFRWSFVRWNEMRW